MEPKISILLPVYNGARFLKGAVGSVLRQNFNDWELLILDDGSSDKTPAIAREYVAADKRIRYEPNPKNIGIQKTLNRGLALAHGEYIARIDDDDWLGGRLAEAQLPDERRNHARLDPPVRWDDLIRMENHRRRRRGKRRPCYWRS